MRIEKVYFEAEDGLELVGLLHTSEERNDDEVVISVHGMGSNCLKKRDDIIAKTVTDNKISYFCFNNRGQGLINTFNTRDGKLIKGTVFEDVTDSYYDIVGAIKKLIEMGYKKIHIQGHSLGSTKTVYTYNKLIKAEQFDILKYIKSIILLSLVDVVDVMNFTIKCNPHTDIVKIAKEMESAGNNEFIIETRNPFLPYVSVGTFIRYYEHNKSFDFVRYNDENFDYKELSNIDIPLFMRWGNNRELISVPADQVVSVCKKKIKNDFKDIGYIDGANHNYTGKEQILANEILDFIKRT